MTDDPFALEGEPVELIPQPPKRNIWQMRPNKHGDVNALLDDSDAINIICDLYDNGVTLKMIKAAFKEIEKERGNDFASDMASIENREYW